MAAALLTRSERRSADPLIPLHLFTSRVRRTGLLIVAVGGLGPTGAFVLLGIHMQEHLGMSPMEAGLATLPYPLGMAVAAQFVPRAVQRWGTARVAAVGLTVAAFATGYLGLGARENLTAILVTLVVMAASMSPAFVAGSHMAMDDVADEHAGAGGAVMNSAAEIGGAIGVSALSAIALGGGGFGAAVAAAGLALLCGALYTARTVRRVH